MSFFYELHIDPNFTRGHDQEPCEMSFEMNIGSRWIGTGGHPKGKVIAWLSPGVIRIQSENDNFLTFPTPGESPVRGKLTINTVGNPVFAVTSLQRC